MRALSILSECLETDAGAKAIETERLTVGHHRKVRVSRETLNQSMASNIEPIGNLLLDRNTSGEVTSILRSEFATSGGREMMGRYVSRETIDQLTELVRQLRLWNRNINLVSGSTLNQLWGRHILDSAQILRLRPKGAKIWADIGTGAGFPGLVLAIMARNLRPDLHFLLLEPNQRKVEFLRSVVRATDAPATVLGARSEEVEPIGADVVSSRAVAGLDRLIRLAARHVKEDGTCIFHKGAKAEEEVNAARECRELSVALLPSVTSEDGSILIIEGKERARRTG